MKRLAVLFACLMLAGCGHQPPVGRILSYTRSNSDGSEAERVHVYRESASHIAVNKSVSPCTTSALVTADLDLKAGQAVQLTAGKLNRAGGQDAFGTLTLDRGRLHLDMGDATEDLAVPVEPWMLYDFDLADLTSVLPLRRDYRSDFTFGVALVWPEPDAKLLQWLGQADARFTTAETWQGRAAYRFTVTGGLTGSLWIDAKHGHVLEARFDRPNHPEYADYHLVLDRVDDGGAPAWRALLADHWRGCTADD